MVKSVSFEIYIVFLKSNVEIIINISHGIDRKIPDKKTKSINVECEQVSRKYVLRLKQTP